MVGEQQLVLFAQPVGVPVGGLGVDLAPLRVLLADRLARRRAVAPLLALRGDLVGGVPGLLAPRSPFGTSDLALFGPVAVRVQAVPVVPGVVACVSGGDDAASELEQ